MSGDNTEQNTPAPPAPKATGKDEKTASRSTGKKPRQPGRAASLLAVLALLLAVAALAVSGWMVREDYFSQEGEDPALQALRQDLQSLGQQQRKLEGALESQRESLAQLRSDQQRQLGNLLDRSQQLEATVDKLATVDRRDWLIAEAEYLLRLANQRLQLGRDARAAAQLLASADQVLLEMDDAGLHTVRAELAKEIATLQSVAEFDTEGLYLRLEGLGEALAGLQLFQPPRYQAEPPPAQDSNWQDRLRSGFVRAWEKLSSYIRIRHREENFQALLGPEQEAVLRHNLQLMVEQAQMALLAERPKLYRRSLEKARDWLKDYYQLDEQADTQLAVIDELLAVPIERQMPDISASLAALKRFIDSRRWQQEVRR